MEFNEKFCPVCKNKNERRAIVCMHCGALLEDHQSTSSSTVVNACRMVKLETKFADLPIDDSMIPEEGIAFFSEGMSKPVNLHFERELILGRKGLDLDGTSSGNTLDLSELGSYQMGISRRHAMIRRTEAGYELIDLSSRNGSWLNNERLVPNKPYPLASGSQLCFGRLRLLVLYHSASESKILK